MSKKHYIAMLEVDNKYYIIAHPDGALFSKNTEEETLVNFTTGYDTRHLLEKKISASSLLHNIQLTPKVLGLTLEEITSQLLDLEKGVKVMPLRSNAGSYTVLECNGPGDIKKIYESGKNPNLISESVKQKLRK